MSNVEAFSSSAHLFLTIVAGFFLLAQWREYRLDALRQRLFEVRDRLFDLGLSGQVPFDHPAYGQMRKSINGMIRFAHRISFFRLIFVSFASPALMRGSVELPSTVLQKRASDLPEDARATLMAVHREMWVTVTRHMITGSPLLLLVLAFVGLYELFSGAARRVIQASAEFIAPLLPGRDAMEAEALEAQERETNEVYWKGAAA